MLAIDLYNKAYRGGYRPVSEVNREFPGSCGENAWKALEPTQDAVRGRTARAACRSSTRRDMSTPAACARRTDLIGKQTEDVYDIQEEVAPAARRARDLQGAGLGLLRHAAHRPSAQ